MSASGAIPSGYTPEQGPGELKNFIGIDSPYEVPVSPEVHLKTLGAQKSLSVDGALSCYSGFSRNEG
jgi:adenylylsulfate kinase-like enzyme